jgi:hypothetical protein
LGLTVTAKEQLELIPELSSEEQALYDILSSAQKELTFDDFMLKTQASVSANFHSAAEFGTERTVC